MGLEAFLCKTSTLENVLSAEGKMKEKQSQACYGIAIENYLPFPGTYIACYGIAIDDHRLGKT